MDRNAGSDPHPQTAPGDFYTCPDCCLTCSVPIEYGKGMFAYGADGACHMSSGGWSIEGQRAWQYDGEKNNPYQTEHDDLFASIRSGTPLNEGRLVAESTMTAIMGRMATYYGKAVSWDEALHSDERWGPKSYELGPLPVDPVPMPGRRRR